MSVAALDVLDRIAELPREARVECPVGGRRAERPERLGAAGRRQPRARGRAAGPCGGRPRAPRTRGAPSALDQRSREERDDRQAERGARQPRGRRPPAGRPRRDGPAQSREAGCRPRSQRPARLRRPRRADAGQHAEDRERGHARSAGCPRSPPASSPRTAPPPPRPPRQHEHRPLAAHHRGRDRRGGQQLERQARVVVHPLERPQPGPLGVRQAPLRLAARLRPAVERVARPDPLGDEPRQRDRPP